jgi:glycine/D-amino acid oxidase-like deaminating enzyme
VRQLPDGRILASAVANHQGDNATDVTERPKDIAARVLRWLDPLVADATLDWDRVALACRPMPEDGLPVIGVAGPTGLHLAVMHSGVTLAAITGEAVAAEVLGQGAEYGPLLAPYRPSRFL